MLSETFLKFQEEHELVEQFKADLFTLWGKKVKTLAYTFHPAEGEDDEEV